MISIQEYMKDASDAHLSALKRFGENNRAFQEELTRFKMPDSTEEEIAAWEARKKKESTKGLEG